MLSYNGKGFDVRMIIKDFREVGLSFDIDKVFYDSYLLESIIDSIFWVDNFLAILF